MERRAIETSDGSGATRESDAEPELRAALERERELRLRAEARYEEVRRLPWLRRLLKNLNFGRQNRWSMAPAGDGVDPGASIFFLVGRGKSGTSWLMEMLDQHPEILCRGEGQFFGRGDLHAPPHARSLYRALLDSPDLREWAHHCAWTRGADYEAEVGSIAAAATAHILRSRLAGSGKRIAGDKTPLNGTDVVSQIAAGLPRARVVHLIRDGRDASISAVHHIWNNRERLTGEPLDPELAAKRDRYRADPTAFGTDGESLFTKGHLEGAAARWRRVTESARQDGTRLLGDAYLEVRYEQLLERPVEELERVLGFLEVEAGSERARSCAEGASFERSTGRERGEEDPESFRRRAVAGEWRELFTAEDREAFKRAAGDLLIELGYERDASW